MDLNALKTEGLATETILNGKSGWRLTPGTAGQVAQLLHQAEQTRQKIALTEMAAAGSTEPIHLDLGNLKQVRKYPVDDFIIEVETGMTMGALDQLLAENRQLFPLRYPDETRLIDVLAEERPALETGLQGYPRDYVLKTEIATPDGQLTISGADVVKNVTGYDLAKLYVGGYHAFGVLTSVTLKLAARPESRMCRLFTFESVKEAQTLTRQLSNSNLPMSICELTRQNQTWELLIEISGDTLLIEECAVVLSTLATHPSRTLETAEARDRIRQLQLWPTGQTVVEAALPLGQWPCLMDTIIRLPVFKAADLQIRPAAGLVYVILPEFRPDLLETLSQEAQQQDGFIRLIQAPDTQAGQFARYNLPADAVTQGLLKALKQAYDPRNTLHDPRLPLIASLIHDEEVSITPA